MNYTADHIKELLDQPNCKSVYVLFRTNNDEPCGGECAYHFDRFQRSGDNTYIFSVSSRPDLTFRCSEMKIIKQVKPNLIELPEIKVGDTVITPDGVGILKDEDGALCLVSFKEKKRCGFFGTFQRHQLLKITPTDR